MNPADAPNLNYAWCGLLVEELVRQGVSGFVISPGSRSAPLTVSVARNEGAKYWVHYDERGAAFFALGLAKAARKPAVLICTSGSAAANYWPAVVEAAMDRVPLILLTADRPPELLDCGANQAIDQTHLYGNYARWYAALPCPAAEIDPAYVLTTADQAWHRSQHPLAGPVHINVALREPLDPAHDRSVTSDTFAALADWAKSGAPYTRYSTRENRLADPEQAALLATIQSTADGLLLIGRLRSPRESRAAARLARALGWPAYADIASGIHGPDAPEGVVPELELIMADPALAADWTPTLVLHVGGGFTAKTMLQFLDRTRPHYIQVCDTELPQDPNHQVSQHIPMAVAPFCDWLAACLPAAKATLPEALAKRQGACREALASEEQETQALTEHGVARLLGILAPPNSLLFAGNSMPVRLMERFGRVAQSGVRVAANRGASGIDGNIATALGMAASGAEPASALVGDLTALHDLNSLALAAQIEVPFVLVVLNNDGGGIFHHLPIARSEGPCFEPCFGTPHGLAFADAARQFGWAYANPETPAAFRQDYTTALARGGATLLEVPTDRYEGREALHQIVKRAVTAMDAARGGGSAP